MNLDSKAEVRGAVRRLMAAATAASHTATEVHVQRRDLELLLTTLAVRLYPEVVARPQLDPRQR